MPEENFWTLWCKGRLTQADTQTIRLGATPSGLTSAHLHHIPHIFLQAGCPSCRPSNSVKALKAHLTNQLLLICYYIQHVLNLTFTPIVWFNYHLSFSLHFNFTSFMYFTKLKFIPKMPDHLSSRPHVVSGTSRSVSADSCGPSPCPASGG